MFGSITHRGGRDARVPVRRRFAAVVCLSADGGRGKPMRFGVPAVGEYANVTARRSVTHLTLTCNVFRSNCQRAIMIHRRRNRSAVCVYIMLPTRICVL
ncbi:MAG: hypothetical protein LBQ66_13885 [Planctomycetaceae bacterium]|nr:hypothetical protein [Planctomycetaceae bacterium]